MVSAIITTHDRLEYLKKAIESVLNQTYKNLELIVVDDNSKEDTVNYLEKISKNNSKIKYIRNDNPKLSGGNYARNLGIKNSTGEYIAFLDDDDEWMRDKIEKQVNILDNNKDVGMVYCNKKTEFLYNENKMYKIYELEDDGIKDYSKHIFECIICTTSEIMVRKSLLEKIGLFDENLKFWQDYDLEIRICLNSKVYNINEPLILYRVNLSDGNRKTNKFEEWLKAVDYIHKKYEKEYKALSKEEYKNSKIMFYYDAVGRCNNIGNSKMRRKYLKLIFKTSPSIKTFAKYLLNTDSNNILIKNFKKRGK